MNLVPNSNFESLYSCPTNFGQICNAENWFQPALCPQWGPCACSSSDIFNACSSNYISVPSNDAGSQLPLSGNGYAGISPARDLNSTPDYWREYLEAKLLHELQSNRSYCVKWFYSLAEISLYGCNRIGAHFSSDTLLQTGSQYDYINVIPQIENSQINSDTANWTLFYQSFVAQGGEEFMTIGNFRPGSMVDTSEIINPSGAWAYYYFDDFGVYLLPEIDAGSGGEICNFGQSVQLQASCTDCWDGLEYRWWPTEGLSDPDSLSTLATPNKTTTYYFGLIDPTETVPCIVDLVDSVTVTVCEGVVPSGFDFAIVPNPSSDQVKLVFSQQTTATTLKLYDARGRLIREEDIPANAVSYVLNIEELSAGQYSIELRNSSGEARQKLVKM